LVKTIESVDDPLVPGSGSVTFAIEVINQGTVNATMIEVTDYIPAGLTLSDFTWTDNGDGTATFNQQLNVQAGLSQVIYITFTVDADASGTINNYAEISEAFDDEGNPGDDIDSTPDDNNNNDPLTDDVTDNSNGDE